MSKADGSYFVETFLNADWVWKSVGVEVIFLWDKHRRVELNSWGLGGGVGIIHDLDLNYLSAHFGMKSENRLYMMSSNFETWFPESLSTNYKILNLTLFSSIIIAFLFCHSPHWAFCTVHLLSYSCVPAHFYWIYHRGTLLPGNAPLPITCGLQMHTSQPFTSTIWFSGFEVKCRNLHFWKVSLGMLTYSQVWSHWWIHNIQLLNQVVFSFLLL